MGRVARLPCAGWSPGSPDATTCLSADRVAPRTHGRAVVGSSSPSPALTGDGVRRSVERFLAQSFGGELRNLDLMIRAYFKWYPKKVKGRKTEKSRSPVRRIGHPSSLGYTLLDLSSLHTPSPPLQQWHKTVLHVALPLLPSLRGSRPLPPAGVSPGERAEPRAGLARGLAAQFHS